MSQRSALRAFITKELRHIARDKQTLTILVLMPLVQVVLFGYALRSDVRDVRLAIVDPEPDYATTSLTSRFRGTDRFTVVSVSPDARSVEPLMRADRADIAVVFEPGFATHLEGNEPAKVLIAVDASDPNTGTTMQNFVRAVINQYEMEIPRPDAINIAIDTRMHFNPTLESVNLFVPGLIALVLTLISALMTAISLSREKERGTLEVLLVSPLEPWQIIVGKVAPYLGIAFGNAVTALFVARIVFGVPVRGSLTLLLLESLLYSVVSLALGVLIAARTTSQRAAMLAAMLGTLMPSTLLSGMIFPISSMPGWLATFSNIIPARWFVVIVRGIMLKGVGLNYLWKETLVLCAMTLILMAVAVRSFKPRLG